MAETFTNNLKLSKRDTGDLNWGAGANANLDVVDAHAQLKNLRPPRSLLASLGSGGVGSYLTGNATYFYKVTAVNELGETSENKIPVVTEAQITEPASPVPVILSWETVPGATGYKIYKGNTANAEEFLTQVSGESTATYTDSGNTAVQSGQTVPANNTALLSVTGVRKLGQANPLRGDVKFEAGANVVLTQDAAANKITIDAAGGGVSTLRKEGEGSGLLGDVKLRAGSNIALTQDVPGNAIEIAATSSGGVTSLRKTGDATGLTGNVSIDQGTDITISEDVPNNKLVVSYSGTKGYATVIAPAPNGTNDTTNLQAALDAVPSGTGGVVVLREGVYRVDSLTLQRTGTRLVGSGSGKDLGSDSKGTQIRSTGYSGDILKIQANNVTIENITFYGLQLPDGYAIVSGSPSVQITRCEIKGCLFDGIRAPLDGIRIPLVFFLNVVDCEFWMSEVAAQATSRTPNAIKIGPTTYGFTLDEVLITNCLFRINYPSPTSGTITAKAIDLTKVKSAVIANCQGLGVNASANRVYIFAELKQDASLGSNAIVKGNSVTGFTNLIKQTSGFPKVSVGNNVFSQAGGTDPAIDLASGNTEWAITGNVIEGTTGINLQAGADNNVVVGNVANIANAGSGNSFGSGGGQSPFTAVVAAPTGVAATDTANIQNAINATPSSGGTIILKEGNYVINQVTVNKNGLRIIGTGNGLAEDNTYATGTRILGNNAAGPLITILGQGITLENISFDGTNMPDNLSMVLCGDGGTTLDRFISFINCSFFMTKAAGKSALELFGVLDGIIRGCYFFLTDATAQTVTRNPIAIRLESVNRVLISECRIRMRYTTSGGGVVNARCITFGDASDVKIADIQADADGTGSQSSFGFLTSFGSNNALFTISDNKINNFGFFIKLTYSVSSTSVTGNNFFVSGSGTAVDLCTGSLRWIMVGNRLGNVNIQSGSNYNIVVANWANVVDAGTGNVLANNSYA